MVHPGGLEAQRHHSRTLRHYGQIALLPPSRTGSGGVRYYDGDALLRLQRILLLRRLGLSLAVIADVLDGEQEVTDALRTHLALLEQERDRGSGEGVRARPRRDVRG
ncbi:MerR family transcriptional regulator [Kocuria dechangensis]|uniref:MerR family transcriptional regulator n=1 Tax=Kocuria dechangensis TaxID=1176249 RepID=UPI0035308C6F